MPPAGCPKLAASLFLRPGSETTKASPRSCHCSSVCYSRQGAALPAPTPKIPIRCNKAQIPLKSRNSNPNKTNPFQHPSPNSSHSLEIVPRRTIFIPQPTAASPSTPRAKSVKPPNRCSTCNRNKINQFTDKDDGRNPAKNCPQRRTIEEGDP